MRPETKQNSRFRPHVGIDSWTGFQEHAPVQQISAILDRVHVIVVRDTIIEVTAGAQVAVETSISIKGAALGLRLRGILSFKGVTWVEFIPAVSVTR
jgi:hypothetical protein